MRTIRARLMLGLVGGMLIVQLMIHLVIYTKIEDEIDDLFDGELERSALAVSHGAAPLPVATPRRQVENPQEGMVVTIWDQSADRPTFQSMPLALPRDIPAGFSKRMIGQRQWRLFGVATGGLFVVTAQPGDVRNVAARKITMRVLLPSLAALPTAALMIWLAVSFGLKPLMRITAELRARSHRDLAPIDTACLPQDIAPVVRALNELMLRLGKIIAAQRHFIGDAAHELLTPLTALTLQAQLLARAEAPARRREAVLELQGGIARTLELAQQLLALARHEANGADPDAGPVDLECVLRNVLAIHAPLAQVKSIRAEVSVQGNCLVAGNEEALSTLLSNLIDNAIKYSDRDGSIHVQARRVDARVLVDIDDSGPGIPPEDRERVFDRFYRRTGHTAGGSGLGLAIAREIAGRHGAVITLHASRLGGLAARVDFLALAERAHADTLGQVA